MNFADFKKASLLPQAELDKVDLHLHTSWSDGQILPEELVKQAAEKGLKLISITDHNSIEAYYSNKIFDLAKELGLALLPGVEMDCGSDVDILVYDKEPNKISIDFLSKISWLLHRENELRQEEAQKCLEDIRKFWLKEDEKPTVSWTNWSNWNEHQKNLFLRELNLDNLLRIDLKTSEISHPLRTYVGTPHFSKLLLALDLINKDAFMKAEKIREKEEINNNLRKFIFEKITSWKYEQRIINESLLQEITSLGFVTILAHPGKVFYSVMDNKNPSEQDFMAFVSDFVKKYKLSGAEGFYRRYHNPKLDYNALVIKALEDNYNITGGSDGHKGFID